MARQFVPIELPGQPGDFMPLPGSHNGLPVAGYRPQSQSNVDMVNLNKQLEERVLRQLDELARIAATDGSFDPRWLAIGRTSIEQGFMAVNRAVFRPARASLPEDTDAGRAPD